MQGLHLSLDPDHSLQDAIALSLLCDARADEDEFLAVKEWEPSRRGSWIDQLEAMPIGSKLWLLRRAPRDEETLARAEYYVVEALGWLLDQGRRMNVDCQWIDDHLYASIVVEGLPDELRYRLE